MTDAQNYKKVTIIIEENGQITKTIFPLVTSFVFEPVVEDDFEIFARPHGQLIRGRRIFGTNIEMLFEHDDEDHYAYTEITRD